MVQPYHELANRHKNSPVGTPSVVQEWTEPHGAQPGGGIAVSDAPTILWAFRFYNLYLITVSD